jgi:hypothetical protein
MKPSIRIKNALGFQLVLVGGENIVVGVGVFGEKAVVEEIYEGAGFVQVLGCQVTKSK